MKNSNILLLFVLLLSGISCREKKGTQEKIQPEEIIGMLPAQSKFILLIDSGKIQIDKNHLFLDNQGNPYVSIDSIIVPLLAKDSIPLLFPFSISPEQMCSFMDGSIFFLQDTCLEKLADEAIQYAIPFPYRQITICKAGENGVYLFGFSPVTGKNDLYFIDKENEELTKLLSDSLPVGAVLGTGRITMIAMDSILYLMNDGEMRALFNAGNIITSLAENDVGIFYATTHNAGYLDEDARAFVFYNRGVSKLLTSNDSLYLLDESGRFSMITQTNGFKNLTDSLTYK